MKAGGSKKPTRSHTFGGCKTCRRRHVKCDKVRPMCLTCRAIGGVCEGFSQELKWVASPSKPGSKVASADPAGLSVRRHLYTGDSLVGESRPSHTDKVSSEATRESMSQALRSDLAQKPVDESLTELDVRCRDCPGESVLGVTVGPFGVFSLHPQSQGGLIRTASPQPTVEPEAVDTSQGENILLSADSIGSLSDMHDFLDWPDLFDLDLTSYEMSPHTFGSGFQNSLSDHESPIRQIDHDHNFEIGRGNSHPSVVPTSLVSAYGGTKVTLANLDPAEAQQLLTHFKDHVISQLRIMPIEKKSPWEVNNLNAAILTLARLSYMTSQPVSHAALANLLALLALSAKNMATRNAQHDGSSSGYWQDFAARAIGEAKENLQRSLQNETRGSNAAKYKDQLMAILALLAYTTLNDQQQDARAYLIDAERLLRVRGLAKRNISRKARELHHVYTWTRIVEESTFVLRNYEPKGANIAAGARNQTRDLPINQPRETRSHAQLQTGPNPRLDDFLRFNTPTYDGEAGAGIQKDNETGQRDIHLEDSREFASSMYTELYGISETWLSLVSQTTRLANAIDRLEADKDCNDIKYMEAIERRKQTLEDMVCSFAAIERQDVVDLSSSCAPRSSVEIAREAMGRALNSALVIFYYRRIRRVNPWILQEYVKNIIQALSDYDASCRDAEIQGTGSPWPAFMAGCEALHTSQRDYLRHWFDKAFAATGFARLKTAEACMKEVWRRREQPVTVARSRARDQGRTWEQISKEWNVHFLLS